MALIRRPHNDEINGQFVATHRKSHTKTYSIWANMLYRCNCETAPNYSMYGGRGIEVCDRWSDFSTFLSDMGEKPDNMSLDRINNSGNYTPNNCKWATVKEQASNRRDNVMITHEGITKSLVGWADFLQVSYTALKNRYRRGWDIRKMLTTPVASEKFLPKHRGCILC